MPASIPYDEEEDGFYDEYYDTYGGPDAFGGGDYWPVQVPEEVLEDPPPQQGGFEMPGYVRTGRSRPAQFWEDQYEYAPRGISAEEAARAAVIPPSGVWDPSAGLVPLSKLALSPEEVEAGMEAIFSPFLSEEDRRALMEAPLTPSSLAKTTAGLSQAGYGVAESLTSPVNLALLGGTAAMGGLPVVPRLLSGAFALDMAQHVPELAQELGAAYESGDEERIARAAGNLGATGAFTAAAGTHAARPRITVPEGVLPPSDNPRVRAIEEALSQQPTGERYASSQPQAAEVYGDVRQQPIAGEQAVPAEVGGQRVQPSPAGDAAGVLGAEEARVGELPVEVTVKAKTPAGEEIDIRMNPAEAERRLTQRKSVLEALEDCLGRK